MIHEALSGLPPHIAKSATRGILPFLLSISRDHLEVKEKDRRFSI
jgi:hypothetical protein